jgi:hypothetical protein
LRVLKLITPDFRRCAPTLRFSAGENLASTLLYALKYVVIFKSYTNLNEYVLRKSPEDARIRRTYVFSNRTIANMKELLLLEKFANETEIIEEAILGLVASIEGDNGFPEERVRKNYAFKKETVDLAIERFTTLYRMGEGADAIPIPEEKESITSKVKGKKGKSALVK